VVLFAASLKMLVSRKVAHLYVSQWYLLGAVFWFPFLYVAAMLLIFVVPAPGTVKAVANWWFAHNVLGLWFTPIGLATVYYLIPKVLGRPIHSYYLSILGFWTVALFYNWAGTHHLISGPLPAWLISVGIVGSIMMFVPVVTVAINHHMTMVGHFRLLRRSPTLRFTVFGAMSYTVVSVQGSLTALRSVNQTTHFTHYTIAHAHLGVYAFFTMVMFGAYYYVMPRLTGREWTSATLIRVHFWGTALGMSLYFVALTWAGIFQGRQMNSSDVPFMQIVRYTVPYLQWRSVAGVLMTVGHLAFAVLVVQMLLGRGRKLPGPTLLGRRQPLFSWRRQDNPGDAHFPGGLK
jgi:cytochrome c oxidase cbb3-type subunit 1